FYRLAHAESDGLPGTVIDRFGDALVMQVNTAGMQALMEELLQALDDVIAPRRILLRSDGAARALEGLESDVRVVRGSFDGPLEVLENGATYLADPAGGQKTGWYYDQRDNRAWVARLCEGARVLDLYSYTGGFSVLAAVKGAREVLAVDRSEAALELLGAAAESNGVAGAVATRRAEVFEEAQRLREAGERFDTVIVDPPAFVKTKKDMAQGLRGYRKLFRAAARLVKPGGVLFAASCSHHVGAEDFDRELRRALADAGRSGRLLRASGAGADHPVHIFLPESEYLKGRLLLLD
ncbi:MAG: class I SAM-dependent rRNA methyltransferase, partial [Rhodovibrionaceae bacterium]|nr:class I SAM-dependent rRNA methyltransferase [Rhodovibrionaceae bacterium]